MTHNLQLPLSADADEIIDADGNRIMDATRCYDFSQRQSVLQAEEIVLRVNLHDTLVLALRSAIDGEGIHAARAILAKVDAAKGEG